MIYDCFAFFNELDLLEIRLQELDSVVDQFVLVEATRTFQKKEKPLYFELNKKRFEKYLPKIKHIIVDEYPNFFTHWRIPKTWDYDNHQKEQILLGLKDCKADDLIIVSDLDEIPKAEKVLEYKNSNGIRIFRQKLYYYYLNCMVVDFPEPVEWYQDYKPWNGTVMCEYKYIHTIKETRDFKDQKRSDFTYINDGGWHYSYLGGTAKVLEKIESYAHKEFNKPEYKDLAKIEQMMKDGKDLFGRNLKTKFVNIDEDAPKCVLENKEKYKSLIL